MFSTNITSKSTLIIHKKNVGTSISKLKSFNDIPGPISYPIIGSLHKYIPFIGSYGFDRLYLNGVKKYQQYGPVVREQIVPGVNIVWLYKPEDIQSLFRYEGKYPQRRSHLALEHYRMSRQNVYNTGGLLPTNGDTWWKLRKVFQKGLSSPASVQNFLSSSDEIINDWFEYIEEVEAKNNDYLNHISRLFLELTCYSVFDLRLNAFSNHELRPGSRSSKLMKAAEVTNSCILKTDNGPQLWRKFETPMYKRLKKSQQYMEEVAIDLLSLKISLFKDPQQPSSLLESYLSSPDVDFKDIIGMVCDFLLAGIDTTAYTTSFVLYYLAKNPQVQFMVYEEAQKLLPRPNSPVTVDVLSQAQYTKAVFKETLRLRPISVGIGRILDSDGEFSNYEVPKGTVVVSQNEVSCRLEKYFPKPFEFKPERWLKNHILYKQSHPFLLLPFGHGPRSCIARRLAEQNIVTLVIKLIRNYEIRWNGCALETTSLLINKPNGPISLSIKKRPL